MDGKLSRASLVVQCLSSALQCRGYWFDSRTGKIPCAVGQLSLCTTTTVLSLWSLQSAAAEACTL